MSKVTITDYETVEVEKEKFECDECEGLFDAEDIQLVVFGDDPDSDITIQNRTRSKHVCNLCTGFGKALRIQEKKEYMKEIGRGLNFSLVFFAFSLGVLSMFFSGAITIDNTDYYALNEPIIGFGFAIAAFLVGVVFLGIVFDMIEINKMTE